MLHLEGCPIIQSSECKGLVFRGYNTVFRSGNHIANHQGIKLLKRKSCPGCDTCENTLDCFDEDINCGTVDIPTIEHDKLYSLRWINDGRDWETGYVDAHVQVYRWED